MALAQRVWLEPEEEQTQVVLRQRRRQQARGLAPVPAQWRHPGAVLALPAVLMVLLVVYIGAHACIARNDLKCQVLQRQLAQMERERIQNNLTIDRLAAQPRLIQLAQLQGLQQPTADHVRYVRVAAMYPRATLAQTHTPGHASWVKHTSRQVVAALQRLRHGPGEPATVQE